MEHIFAEAFKSSISVMEAFVESFVEAFVEAPVGVTLVEACIFIYVPWNNSCKLS